MYGPLPGGYVREFSIEAVPSCKGHRPPDSGAYPATMSEATFSQAGRNVSSHLARHSRQIRSSPASTPRGHVGQTTHVAICESEPVSRILFSPARSEERTGSEGATWLAADGVPTKVSGFANRAIGLLGVDGSTVPRWLAPGTVRSGQTVPGSQAAAVSANASGHVHVRRSRSPDVDCKPTFSRCWQGSPEAQAREHDRDAQCGRSNRRRSAFPGVARACRRPGRGRSSRPRQRFSSYGLPPHPRFGGTG